MAHFPTPPLDGHGPVDWSPEDQAEIAELMTHYPTKRSALLPILWMAQRKWGWLSFDVMRLVATTVDLPPSEVYSVATFYTMLKKQPTGKYLIQVCHTLSCKLAGAEQIVDHIKKKLGISEGETTPDGMFTLMRVECLASCGSAPMMQIDDDFHEQLTPDSIDAILDGLAQGQPLPSPRPEVDQWTFRSLES
ncbi:MAG: NADH-quinone oxidoreductase subunit NuoE [Oligoflexia bacterium]|nr:NADH-quinone oxidoreductase subunit NuoE [Oligoflexia bacterium]